MREFEAAPSRDQCLTHGPDQEQQVDVPAVDWSRFLAPAGALVDIVPGDRPEAMRRIAREKFGYVLYRFTLAGARRKPSKKQVIAATSLKLECPESLQEHDDIWRRYDAEMRMDSWQNRWL